MGFFAAIPILILSLMVQLTVASNLPLLGGTADLVMVVLITWSLQERVKSAWFWAIFAGALISYISAMPTLTPLIGYLLIVGIVRLLRRRAWQIPILILFLSTVLGTAIQHLLYLVALFLAGTALPLQESLSWVTLPSILLNLLIALPVYVGMTDLARWVYPVEATA